MRGAMDTKVKVRGSNNSSPEHKLSCGSLNDNGRKIHKARKNTKLAPRID
jgi:hypothetical protein